MSDDVRLGRGLYRPADSVHELPDRCAAYLDVLPASTAIDCLTAGRLHGLWLPTPTASEKPQFVVSRSGTAACKLARSERPEIVVRRRHLNPEDVVVVGGLPVLSVEQTWLELANRLSLEDLVAAGDSALRGSVTRADLLRVLRASRRRRGVVRARQAFDLLDERSRSRPESHLRCIVVVAGLPYPAVNEAIVNANGEWLCEPDLHFKRARLALEYNGAGHADVERMRRDITRELDVDESGWKIVVFGPTEVFRRTWRIPAYVRALLNERDPGWERRPYARRRPLPMLSGGFGSEW